MPQLDKKYFNEQMGSLLHRLNLSDIKTENVNWRLESMDQHFDSYSRSLATIVDDMFVVKTTLSTLKNQLSEIVRILKIEEKKSENKFKS